MKNQQKGSTTLVLIIIFLLVIGFGGYIYSNKNVTQTANTQAPIQTNGITYKMYSGNGYTFEYPNNWTVRENFYATPGQQDAGQKGDVVSLSVISPTGQEIVIGGRQAQCRPSTTTVKAACFKNDIPVTMLVTDAESVTVFERLVTTLKQLILNHRDKLAGDVCRLQALQLTIVLGKGMSRRGSCYPDLNQVISIPQ